MIKTVLSESHSICKQKPLQNGTGMCREGYVEIGYVITRFADAGGRTI